MDYEFDENRKLFRMDYEFGDEACCIKEQVDIVDRLITTPFVEPSDDNNYAIRGVSHFGRFHI